jgi:2-polyprenyl-3-methyl-5-hydroxy-6-metoxy-1,4-benzoquinol methylase
MQKDLTQAAREWLYPQVPARLRRRQIRITADRVEELSASETANLSQRRQGKERCSEPTYHADAHEHLLARTESDRRLIVPWLDAACCLDGLRILEVGCGTGCSTVVLAEQGALVTGIDVDADALRVAHDRCRLYGLHARLLELNAVEAARHFRTGDFDLIIFFACLEHMTLSERMEALPALWNLLPDGAWLAIVETPNRLWYFDFHTSLLPFFNWLPDDLAFAYSKFSERERFKDDFRVNNPSHMQEFLRKGRGVSYHEFDLAVGTHAVFSSFSTFYGYRYTMLRSMRARHFKSILRSFRPDLHDGWFEPSLDLLMRKA